MRITWEEGAESRQDYEERNAIAEKEVENIVKVIKIGGLVGDDWREPSFDGVMGDNFFGVIYMSEDCDRCITITTDFAGGRWEVYISDDSLKCDEAHAIRKFKKVSSLAKFVNTAKWEDIKFRAYRG